jgi:hypothetical protein
MRIYGIDFTSAPRPAKPITCAVCDLDTDRLVLQKVETFVDFRRFEQMLARPGPWLGGFDFPFGQPRELVCTLELPEAWEACARMVSAMDAATWRERLADFRAGRPAGSKEPPRLTDRLTGAQSAMKSVNPPVAMMYRAGAARLLAAGLNIVPCRRNQDARSAIETYPGLMARALIGRTAYKSDRKANQTRERTGNRRLLIQRLRERLPALLGLELVCSPYQLRQLQADASGDRLDAVLCAVQAAWASRQPGIAMPADVDTLEGWIPWPGL